jgi:nicotinamide mononucleotide (NMN) deamidase PncC
MDRLEPLAERVAARLAERKETIAVAEGSSGGLIAAALLAVPAPRRTSLAAP